MSGGEAKPGGFLLWLLLSALMPKPTLSFLAVPYVPWRARAELTVVFDCRSGIGAIYAQGSSSAVVAGGEPVKA